MSILTAIWAWFIGTKFGRWLIVLAAIAATFLATAFTMFEKGKRKQAVEDQARQAQADADAARVAKDTYKDAMQAAEEVRKKAAAQPPPDTEKRDDLDNTF